MPSVYAVPVTGVDFNRVGRPQVHHELSRLLGHGSEDWSLRSSPEHQVGSGNLEVGVLTEKLAGRLPRALAVGTELHFVGAKLAQTAVVTGPPVQVCRTDWADLAVPFAGGRPVRSWDVTFQTPACTHPGVHYFPLLDGASVFQSLLAAWRRAVLKDWAPRGSESLDPANRYMAAVCSQYGAALASLPKGLALAGKQWDRDTRLDLHVSAIRGHTEIYRIGQNSNRPAIELHGFVGSLRLVSVDDELAALADCLLRFGEFAGVGAKTSYGFGSMAVSPWRPSSDR
ncbi:MAG: CRISPR system precrRNA processing endoribonuclease RAMP protein Cas6 [Bifidobacteriaceae bacterium]|nr:CRISPR system precrRNA processing endoribonuclease RAMP protein Cas6 [Bifidobacteriaceae bacterium]